MRTLSIAALFVVLGTGLAHGDNSPRIVTDPVTDFTLRHKNDVRTESDKNEEVARLEMDLDNDRKMDVLLSFEKTGLDPEYENRVYNWDVYRKLDDATYAVIELHQFYLPAGPQLLRGAIRFDPDMFYLGFIKEINAFGLLSIFYLPRHNGVELSAYALRGDHFEVLHFPDPKSSPVIYHRDDANKIPDLPQAALPYLAKPRIKKVIIPSAGRAREDETNSDDLSKASGFGSSVVQPSAREKTFPPQPISTRGDEVASPTPWRITAVLIAAATSLLWLLVKRRK